MSPSLTGQILIEDKLTFDPTIYQSHVSVTCLFIMKNRCLYRYISRLTVKFTKSSIKLLESTDINIFETRLTRIYLGIQMPIDTFLLIMPIDIEQIQQKS